MKFIMINKRIKEVIDSIELDCTLNEAKHYFMGVKRLDQESFDKIFLVKHQIDKMKPHKWYEEDKFINDDDIELFV